MAKIERVEDIEAWQMARELVADIYKCSRDGSFRRDPSLRDQLRRAAISVPANVAEGFGRKTNKDFANFLYIAKGSATEVISPLRGLLVNQLTMV